MDITQAYFGDIDLSKSYKDDKGNYIVYGKVTGPQIDLDGHRCDPSWLQKSMPAWSEWGNVRAMHQPIAAGVGLELADEADNWYLAAKIVDADSINKIEEGVYKGFSIGVKGAGIYKDAMGQDWINRGIVAEVSLVDRPCLPDSVFDGMYVAKAYGDHLSPVNLLGKVLATDKDGNIIPTPNLLAKAGVAQTQQHVDGAGMAPQEGDVNTTPQNPAGQDVTPNGITPDDDPDTDGHSHEHHHGNGIGHHSHVHVHPHTDGDHQRGDAGYTPKAVTPDGEVDEAPDIDCAEHAMQLIGQLISNEADEICKAGEWDETCDIGLLLDAMHSLRCFRRNEMMSQASEDDGGSQMAYDRYMMAEADLFKAHRKFSAENRKELAGKGHALADGSYPIPDADALRRAAILARSHHGNWQAAEKLIARRAKDLKVPNPLSHSDSDSKTTDKVVEPDVTPEVTTEVTTDINMSLDPDLIKAAISEATKPLEEQLATVQAELAKVLATEVPGPFITTPASLRGSDAKEGALQKILKFERQAEFPGLDPELAEYYRGQARELRKSL